MIQQELKNVQYNSKDETCDYCIVNIQILM